MSDNDGAVLLRRLASALGTIGVTAGAFGAHALKDTLAAKKGAEANWRTAVSCKCDCERRHLRSTVRSIQRRIWEAVFLPGWGGGGGGASCGGSGQ